MRRAQPLRQGEGGVLAHDVGRHVGNGEHPRGGDGAEQAAPAPLEPRRQQVARGVDLRHDVRLPRGLPGRVPGGDAARDGLVRVGAEEVEGPELVPAQLHQRLHVVGIGHVAGGGQTAHRLGGGGGRRLVEVVDHDPRPRFREPVRQGTPRCPTPLRSRRPLLPAGSALCSAARRCRRSDPCPLSVRSTCAPRSPLWSAERAEA